MKNDAVGVRKGAWTKEEDFLLSKCIETCGEGKWHLVPMRAGLNRCRKSCRLRWLNYLRPNIKRGYFNKDEVDLVVRLHKLLGNRWSLIAGRIPGRTANDVKNFWNTNINKKSRHPRRKPINVTETESIIIIKPQPQNFSKKPSCVGELIVTNDDDKIEKNQQPSNKNRSMLDQVVLPEEECNSVDECMRWWGQLLKTTENEYATLSFPEDGDHHHATIDSITLSPELGNQAIHDREIGLSVLDEFDIDVWQLNFESMHGLLTNDS